jgi:hypothetical protein
MKWNKKINVFIFFIIHIKIKIGTKFEILKTNMWENEISN